MLNSGDPFPVNVLQMYDYKMLFVWAEMVFHQVYLLENFGSFTGRFLGSCFYLIHPSYKKKAFYTKQLISTFPLTNIITFMSFSNAKIISMITSFYF